MTKKNTATDTRLRQHVERIIALAAEIEESPSSMGYEDIERLGELHEEADKALAILKRAEATNIAERGTHS